MRAILYLVVMLMGVLLIMTGFQGRVGSLLAAMLAPNALQETPEK